LKYLGQHLLLEHWSKPHEFLIKAKVSFKIWIAKSWILRDFVLANTNSSAHKRGQGVHHTDLQTLFFDLGDMYRPTPKIEDVMEFQKGLSVKENLEIFEV
jgi:hypothetical protein